MLSTSRAALMTMTSTGEPPARSRAGPPGRSCPAGRRRAGRGPGSAGRSPRAPARRWTPSRPPRSRRGRHEPGVHLGHHEVVVDDQDADHESPATVAVSVGRERAVNVEPPTDVAVTSPPRRVHTRCTRDSPMPRSPPSGRPWSRCRGGRSRAPCPAARPARVAHHDVDLAVDQAEPPRPSAGAPGGGVHGVVDEVADDGGDVGAQLVVQGRECRVGAIRRSTPSSAAWLALAMSSAATEGPHRRRHRALNSDRLELTRCTKRTASSDSPSSISPRWCAAGCELVRLGAQGVGDVPGEVELAAQLQQLGAVAQGRHRADRAARLAIGSRLTTSTRPALATGGRAPRRRGAARRASPPPPRGRPACARGVARDAQQPDRLVVDQGDPARRSRPDALADAVQHRVAVLHEAGDLGGSSRGSAASPGGRAAGIRRCRWRWPAPGRSAGSGRRRPARPDRRVAAGPTTNPAISPSAVGSAPWPPRRGCRRPPARRSTSGRQHACCRRRRSARRARSGRHSRGRCGRRGPPRPRRSPSCCARSRRRSAGSDPVVLHRQPQARVGQRLGDACARRPSNSWAPSVDCATVTAVTPTRTTKMITTCSASSWPASDSRRTASPDVGVPRGAQQTTTDEVAGPWTQRPQSSLRTQG